MIMCANFCFVFEKCREKMINHQLSRSRCQFTRCQVSSHNYILFTKWKPLGSWAEYSHRLAYAFSFFLILFGFFVYGCIRSVNDKGEDLYVEFSNEDVNERFINSSHATAWISSLSRTLVLKHQSNYIAFLILEGHPHSHWYTPRRYFFLFFILFKRKRGKF